MLAVLRCGAVSSRHVLGGRCLGHSDRHGVHTVAGASKELRDRTVVAARLRCDELQSAIPVQLHAQAHIFENEIAEFETEFGEEVGCGVDSVRGDGVHDVVDAWGSGPVVRGFHITTLHRERLPVTAAFAASGTRTPASAFAASGTCAAAGTAAPTTAFAGSGTPAACVATVAPTAPAGFAAAATAAAPVAAVAAAPGVAGVVPATRLAKPATAARVGLRALPWWFPDARVPGSRWTSRAWFMPRTRGARCVTRGLMSGVMDWWRGIWRATARRRTREM